MEKKIIAIAKGDGIGPEVVNEGVKILKIIQQFYPISFDFVETPLGGKVLIDTGSNLPEKSYEQMKRSDAILFGAIGLPGLPLGAAESAILKIRHGFNQYVNLRPIKLYDILRDKCPLKEEYIQKGIDFTIVRENTEGLYAKIGKKDKNYAENLMKYSRVAVERLVRYGFEYAKRQGSSEVICVDKANLLECSQFWREIYDEISLNYPKIQKKYFYVDAFCQWLIRKPYTVQTVVTENMFGDIISDEAAYLIGSLGMAASGNINPEGISMYEPIHGSAPDIAGQGIANPIGTILSIKLMMEESFKDFELGQLIENAVVESLSIGRTVDIQSHEKSHPTKIKTFTTIEMGNLIAMQLQKQLRN